MKGKGVKMMNVKEIEKMKNDLRKKDVVELEKLMKNYSSKKCRLKKIEYDVKEMEELLENERICREVIIEKKEKKSVIYERLEEEIKVMNIEEVMKGIKNVDSLRCIENGKRDEFKDKSKIEKMEKVREWLLERKKEVEGNSNGSIKISDVIRKIEDVKSLEELKSWLEEKSK